MDAVSTITPYHRDHQGLLKSLIYLPFSNFLYTPQLVLTGLNRPRIRHYFATIVTNRSQDNLDLPSLISIFPLPLSIRFRPIIFNRVSDCQSRCPHSGRHPRNSSEVTIIAGHISVRTPLIPPTLVENLFLPIYDVLNVLRAIASLRAFYQRFPVFPRWLRLRFVSLRTIVAEPTKKCGLLTHSVTMPLHLLMRIDWDFGLFSTGFCDTRTLVWFPARNLRIAC